jgi:hypothetical protein
MHRLSPLVCGAILIGMLGSCEAFDGQANGDFCILPIHLTAHMNCVLLSHCSDHSSGESKHTAEVFDSRAKLRAWFNRLTKELSCVHGLTD